VPAAAAAAAAGFRFLQTAAGEERRQRLWRRVDELHSRLQLSTARNPGAIVPVMVGAESRAVKASADLRARGIFVPAIRYPTVARGRARLRVTLTAAHSAEDISALARALEQTVPLQS
jgi:8-amino-7-oxononanoate synthase